MGARLVENGYTDTLDGVIVALCRDYCYRRDKGVGQGYSRRTRMEYEYIDSILLRAAGEITGESDAEKILAEIGERVGYAYSAIEGVSESTYKIMKKEVKLNIAKKLHMLD